MGTALGRPLFGAPTGRSGLSLGPFFDDAEVQGAGQEECPGFIPSLDCGRVIHELMGHFDYCLFTPHPPSPPLLLSSVRRGVEPLFPWLIGCWREFVPREKEDGARHTRRGCLDGCSPH